MNRLITAMDVSMKRSGEKYAEPLDGKPNCLFVTSSMGDSSVDMNELADVYPPVLITL